MTYKYAAKTTVPIERSLGEIRSLLLKYGATQFLSGDDAERHLAIIGFIYNKIQIKFVLPLPDPESSEFMITPSGRARRKSQTASQAYEQECRRRWRALTNMVKAKLEAVSSGIATFEEEFLSYTLLPGQQTVGEIIIPRLDAIYQGKPLLPLLPGLKE